MMGKPHKLVEITTPLPWSEKQSKAGTWISTCEPLRLVAWGDTKEDLEICKRKVTTLLLSYLAHHGILESFMHQRNIDVEVSVIVPLPALEEDGTSLPEDLPHPLPSPSPALAPVFLRDGSPSIAYA